MVERSLILLAVTTLICVVVSSTDAQAQDDKYWRWYEVPSPWRRHHECNRPRPSYICDPAGLITQKEADDLDVLLAEIYASTSCNNCGACGSSLHTPYTVNVAIVPRMWRNSSHSNSSEARLADARLFSYWVSHEWQRDDCGANAFVLYLTEQNVLYTLTYPRARQRLSDNLIGFITVGAQERMSQSRSRVQGLRQMITDYKDVFLGRYKP